MKLGLLFGDKNIKYKNQPKTNKSNCCICFENEGNRVAKISVLTIYLSIHCINLTTHQPLYYYCNL